MRQVNLVKNGGKDMVEVMTDRQYDGILQMIEMIVDGCKDLEEAKRKIAELRREKKEREKKKRKLLLSGATGKRSQEKSPATGDHGDSV